MSAQAREELRERIATAALQGLLAHQYRDNEANGYSYLAPESAAPLAVEYADALIAALVKDGGR